MMRRIWKISLVGAVVVIVASVGGYVGIVASSRAPGGSYDTAEDAVNGYLRQHTYKYASGEMKAPMASKYGNGQGHGQYQMTVQCDCNWIDGSSNSGMLFVYLDKSRAGWNVVSVGSGP